MTGPPLAEPESVRLVPALLAPEFAAPVVVAVPVDDDGAVEDGVTVADVAAAVPVPDKLEAVEVVVAVWVVPALVVQLAVDKADTTVDCCPSEFLVAFK